MARSLELSESEILRALQDARAKDIPDPPGAFLVSELARKSGKAIRTIRCQLAVLREKGLVETCKVYRKGSDGRHMMVTAYRILKPDGKR